MGWVKKKRGEKSMTSLSKKLSKRPFQKKTKIKKKRMKLSHEVAEKEKEERERGRESNKDYPPPVRACGVFYN